MHTTVSGSVHMANGQECPSSQFGLFERLQGLFTQALSSSVLSIIWNEK